jgi:excisionase family DNA binding protein
MPALLLAEDVAKELQMSTDWLYSQVRQGRFPAVRVGRYYRFRPEDVSAWIEANTVGAFPTKEKP